MRYIYKIIHLLKDIAFWGVIFILGFMCGAKMISASASDEHIFNYNLQYDFVKNCIFTKDYGVELPAKLDELSSVLKENNIKFSINLYDFDPNYCSYDKFNVQISITEYTNSSMNVDVSSSFGVENLRGVMNFSLDTSKIKQIFSFYSSTSSSYLIERIDKIIEFVNENSRLPLSSDNLSLGTAYFWDSSQFRYMGFNSLRSKDNDTELYFVYANDNHIIYDTNVSFKINSMKKNDSATSYYSKIKIGDNIYRENAILPTYKSVQGYGKTYYTFNGNIEKNGNAQIKFEFEVPQDKLFSFYFNYSVTYGIGYATPPYLEVLSSNRKSVLPLDTVYNEIDKTIYADTQINSFASNIQTVSFVVDLEGLKNDDSSIFIHFDSEYPFTYRYIDSYYTEVDWSGNYGIMLIPKLKQNQGFFLDVYSDIYFKGNQLTMKIFPDNYTDLVPLEEKTYRNYNELWGGYKYYYQSSDSNYKVFFINDSLLFDNHSTILKYDTRYFVHTLCRSKDNCDTIKNPNTDEEITIKPPDGNSDSDDPNSFKNQFVKVKEYLNNLRTTLKPVSESMDYFLFMLPGDLYIWLMVIYFCFLLFGIFKIMRR